jgi:uncharacterized protein
MRLWLLLSVLLFAVLPASTGRHVSDFADLLTPTEEAELEQLCITVEAKTTAEIAVVTVRSLDGLTVEEYANALFNSWGIGKRETNNGVLLLVALDERRMRIEVGYGLEPLLTDSLAGEIRDTEILPSFRQLKYNQGIANGVRALADLLLRYPDAARGVPGAAPKYKLTARKKALLASTGAGAAAIVFLMMGIIFAAKRKYSPVWLFAAAAGVAGSLAYAAYLTLQLPGSMPPALALCGAGGTAFSALLYNLFKFRRFRSHRCPECKGPMLLLDEVKDDEKLSDVQKLEEKLGSVDYDVWYCPACMKSDVDRYVRFFSGYAACPECQHLTYKETRTVQRQPTRFSQGTALLSGLCLSCNHTAERLVIIPRLSSSGGGVGFSGGGGGGGGGFGGGSSGGGGASGGW